MAQKKKSNFTINSIICIVCVCYISFIFFAGNNPGHTPKPFSQDSHRTLWNMKEMVAVIQNSSRKKKT